MRTRRSVQAQWFGQQRKGDQPGRHEASERGEDAHVPHPLDQHRGETRARQEAEEIARGDDGQFRRREPLDPAPQTDEGEMHAVAQHDQHDAEQKGPDARQHLDHGTSLRVSGGLRTRSLPRTILRPPPSPQRRMRLHLRRSVMAPRNLVALAKPRRRFSARRSARPSRVATGFPPMPATENPTGRRTGPHDPEPRRSLRKL